MKHIVVQFPSMNTERGRCTLYLDKSDIRRLKEIAKEKDSSPSRIVRSLVRAYVWRDEHPRKRGKA